MTLIEAIAEFWGWMGIKPQAIIVENDFGNYLIQDVQNCIWRLCPEDLYCVVIAEAKHQLAELFADQEFLHDWNMEVLVRDARENLGSLELGWKYHLVIPGVLGGKYDISNIRMVPQIEQIRFSGDLARQIQHLPDGAQIELKIV